MADHCPLGRCAEPADVARVVAFLASGDAGWVNGKPPQLSTTFNEKLRSIFPRPSPYHLWWIVSVDGCSMEARRWELGGSEPFLQASTSIDCMTVKYRPNERDRSVYNTKNTSKITSIFFGTRELLYLEAFIADMQGPCTIFGPVPVDHSSDSYVIAT